MLRICTVLSLKQCIAIDSNIFYHINLIKNSLKNIKGVIQIRKSKKERQAKGKRSKGQTKIYKTQKAKDRATRTSLKTGEGWGSESILSRRVRSACSTIDTRRVTLVTKPVISHEKGPGSENPLQYICICKYKLRFI